VRPHDNWDCKAERATATKQIAHAHEVVHRWQRVKIWLAVELDLTC
jgi:hypothetical protein